MSKDNDNFPIESIAQAWTVETTDLTSRVAAAIGASTDSLLLTELRALRLEILELRRNSELLHNEVAKLRFDLMNRPAPSGVRLAPYASSEVLARLS